MRGIGDLSALFRLVAAHAVLAVLRAAMFTTHVSSIDRFAHLRIMAFIAGRSPIPSVDTIAIALVYLGNRRVGNLHALLVLPRSAGLYEVLLLLLDFAFSLLYLRPTFSLLFPDVG